MDNNKIDKIAEILYDRISYMYCDNCRLGGEIDEEEAIKKYGYWGCEYCYRKDNGWGISMSESKDIAEKIIKCLEISNET